MHISKKTGAAAAVLLILLTAFLVAPAAADTVIIHTNDVHGRFTDNIGYDGLSAYIQERTAAGDEIVLLDAGDALQGKIEANAFQGFSAVDIMNALKYDTMTVGNHEFEYDMETLQNLREEADFPILAANVFYADTGKPVFEDSMTITTSGYKIGVFGLATPESKATNSKRKMQNLVFKSGDELYGIAQDEVDSLKEQGCTYIICLAHLGIGDHYAPDSSVDVAEHVKGIDLIVDGHSHTELKDGLEVGDTLIVSTGCYLKNIGVVTLQNGKAKAELISDYDKKDRAITDLCSSYIETVTTILSSMVIGETEVPLDAKANPGCRTKETAIGDLMADALLYAARAQGYDADCAVINGAAFKASIPAGKITALELYNTFPSEITLSMVTVPGSVLLNALEKNTADTPEASSGFPQVSGIEYCIDTTEPYVDGEVHRVTISTVNNEPFDAERMYVVASTDRITDGNYRYGDFTSYDVETTAIAYTDVFAYFISEKLGGKVGTEYAKPAGRIHIISAPLTVETSDFSQSPVSSSTSAKAASPSPVFGLLAGITIAGVFAWRRR